MTTFELCPYQKKQKYNYKEGAHKDIGGNTRT